jgi:hypothetical protein
VSTYLYLRCEDHDPPLCAIDESGQHLYDIPQIQADLANRNALVAAAADGMEVTDYFRRHTLAFLTQHPACRVSIFDEYGVEHPTTPADRAPGSTRLMGRSARE